MAASPISLIATVHCFHSGNSLIPALCVMHGAALKIGACVRAVDASLASCHEAIHRFQKKEVQSCHRFFKHFSYPYLRTRYHTLEYTLLVRPDAGGVGGEVMSLTSPDDIDSKQARTWCLEAIPMQKTACFKLILMMCRFSAPSRGLWSGGGGLVAGGLETTDPLCALTIDWWCRSDDSIPTARTRWHYGQPSMQGWDLRGGPRAT
jgi:hypothetical protein